jgi:transposase
MVACILLIITCRLWPLPEPLGRHMAPQKIGSATCRAKSGGGTLRHRSNRNLPESALPTNFGRSPFPKKQTRESPNGTDCWTTLWTQSPELYQLAEWLTCGALQIRGRMIQGGKRGAFAMGQAIAVRTDYTATEVRLLAKQAKDAAQARRLLAIAAVLDGSSWAEAATNAGMDRQTLRDWVIRFNEQGPDGLVNIPSPGAPPKLNDTHKAFLARIVHKGPIPAIHGVVRWRACDLIMRLHEAFGLSVSDDTVYRALKDLCFSHVSARPRAYKQDAEAMETFKKTPSAWRKSAKGSHRALR